MHDDGETAMASIPTAMLMRCETKASKKWIVDSACTSHMTNDIANFISFSERPGKIEVGNKECRKSNGIGTVRISAIVRGI